MGPHRPQMFGCPVDNKRDAHTCLGSGVETAKTVPLPVLGLGITPLSLLLQLKATDADEGEFGRVWYRILHGKSAAVG